MLRYVGLGGGGDAGDVGGLAALGRRGDVVIVVGVDAAETDAALRPASLLPCFKFIHSQLMIIHLKKIDYANENRRMTVNDKGGGLNGRGGGGGRSR